MRQKQKYVIYRSQFDYELGAIRDTIQYEQFFRGETKVSVVDLAKIQRNDKKSIDDYISSFRLMKTGSMTNLRISKDTLEGIVNVFIEKIMNLYSQR